MRRVHAVVVPALAGVLVALTGCSATSVDSGTLADWQQQQDRVAEANPGVLGVLVSNIDAGEQAPQEVEPGVRLQFPASQPVDHLEFSCFGNGQMRAVIRTATDTGSRDTTVGAMRCRDSPHRIAVPDDPPAAIDSVACSAFDSDRTSTWRLVVIGQAQPSG